MLLPVVDELFVDLVGDDIELAADRQARDLLQLSAVPDAAVGVVGRVENEHLRAFGHIGQQILRLGDEALARRAGHHHRHAARQADHLRIGHPARRGDDHLVAGVEQRAQRQEQRGLCAVGHDDLAGGIRQAVVAAQLVADCGAQLQRAGCSGVFGQAHIQRFMRGGTDILRGHKVRLACTEGNHVAAIRAHFLGFGVDRQGRRRRDRAAHMGKLERQSELLLRGCIQNE